MKPSLKNFSPETDTPDVSHQGLVGHKGLEEASQRTLAILPQSRKIVKASATMLPSPSPRDKETKTQLATTKKNHETLVHPKMYSQSKSNLF